MNTGIFFRQSLSALSFFPTHALFISLAFVLISCERKSEENSKVSIQLPLEQITFTKALTRKIEKALATKPEKTKKEGKKAGKKNAKKAGKETEKKSASSDSFVTKTELHSLTAIPEHIVLSITGPDLAPVLCHFEVRSGIDISGPCRPTKSDGSGIEVDLKSGPSRLVQILVAYKTVDGDEAPVIRYGDTNPLIEMKPGNVPVTIQLETIASGVSFGHVAGRFLNADDSGPSGLLTASVKVKSDKPAMTLMRSEIYGGWFQIVATDGMKTEYTVNGINIFGKAMDKSDFQSLLTSQGASPKFLLKAQEDGFEIRGWFGTQAQLAGKTVATSCSPSTSRYESCLDQETYFVGPFAAQANGGFLAQSGNNVTWQYLPGATSGLEGVKVLFNANFAERKNRFRIDRAQYDCQFMNDQSDTVSEFISLPGNFIPVTQNILADGLDPANYQYAVCPVRGGRLMRSAVLEPNQNDDPNSGPEDYLRVEIMGANHVGEGDQEIGRNQCYQAKIKTYRWDGESANPMPAANSMSLVLTPWINATFYSSQAGCEGGSQSLNSPVTFDSGSVESSSFWMKASVIESNKGVSISGHESSPFRYSQDQNRINVVATIPVGQLRIEGSDGTSHTYQGNYLSLTKNFCHPVEFSVYSNSTMTPLLVSADVTITGISGQSGSGITFYDSDSCTQSLSTVTIPSGNSSSSIFFVKATDLGSAKYAAMNVPEDSLLSFTPSSNEFKVGGPKLQLLAPTSVISGYCYKLVAQAKLANGEDFLQASDLSFDFSFGPQTDNNDNIYDTLAQCEGNSVSSTPIIADGLALREFWAKTEQTSGPITISLADPSSGLETASINNVNVAVATSYVATKLRLNHPASLTLGVCTPVRMQLTNESDLELRAVIDYAFGLTPSSTNISLFSDINCTQVIFDQEIFLGAEESFKELYVMANVAGLSNQSLAQVLSSPFTFAPGPNVSTLNPGAGGLAINFGAGQLPNFPLNSIIGSHEFGLARSFSVTPVGTDYLHCEEIDQGYSSSQPCSSDVFINNGSSYTFNWKKEKAFQNKFYRFYAMNGNIVSMLHFNPFVLYGSQFQVVDCGSSNITSSGLVSNDITTAFNSLPAGNKTLCFGSMAQVTCNATIALGEPAAGGARRIIGWSSSPVIFHDNALSSGAACLQVTRNDGSPSPTIIANARFDMDGTSCSGPSSNVAIAVTGSAPTASYMTGSGWIDVLLNNAVVNLTPSASCATKGIELSSNSDALKISIDNTQFNIARDATSAGINLSNTHIGNLELRKVSVNSGGGTYPTYFIFSDNSDPSSMPMSLVATDLTVIGPNMSIVGGTIPENGRMHRLYFKRSVLNLGLTNSSYPIFDLTSIASANSHNFNQGQVTYSYTDDAGLFELGQYASEYVHLALSGNKFVHNEKGNLIKSSITISEAHTINLSLNSILTNTSFDLSALTPSQGMIFIGTSGPTITMNSSLNSTTGLNRICDTNAGTGVGWAAGGLFVDVADGTITAGDMTSGYGSGITPLGANFCP